MEKKVSIKEKFSKKLILDVQKLVEKGASKEKIGLRGSMPPGVLFAVYDSKTGNPDYIPPEYCDIPELLDELVEYVNTTDDHPLIVAAVVHYQLVTIHPFEDGNGRTARLLEKWFLAQKLGHKAWFIQSEKMYYNQARKREARKSTRRVWNLFAELEAQQEGFQKLSLSHSVLHRYRIYSNQGNRQTEASEQHLFPLRPLKM